MLRPPSIGGAFCQQNVRPSLSWLFGQDGQPSTVSCVLWVKMKRANARFRPAVCSGQLNLDTDSPTSSA
jgi:hypothetical protein